MGDGRLRDKRMALGVAMLNVQWPRSVGFTPVPGSSAVSSPTENGREAKVPGRSPRRLYWLFQALAHLRSSGLYFVAAHLVSVWKLRNKVDECLPLFILISAVENVRPTFVTENTLSNLHQLIWGD